MVCSTHGGGCKLTTSLSEQLDATQKFKNIVVDGIWH